MFRFNLKKSFICCTTFIIFVVFTNNTMAIPLFGKKYDTKCFTCHVSEPMLNDFGRKFQAAGYTIAGTTDKVPVWNQTLPTFSVLVGPAAEYSISGGESSLALADFGFDILTGGSLGDKMNYFGAVVVDPLGDGSYEAAVEALALFYNNVVGEMNNVNLGFGKMRLFIPGQGNLSLSNTGYLAYDYDPIGEEATSPFLIGEAQFAVSAFGWLDQFVDGARYQVALTNGHVGGTSLNDNQAIYATLNVTKNIGNSPFRIGGLYYGGKQTYGDDANVNNFSRIGFDVELYDPVTNKLNILGQYMMAEDDNVEGDKLTMTGGFVGAVYPLVEEKLFGYARYDFTNEKEKEIDQTQMTFGGRYHIAPNVYLFGEYGQTLTTEAGAETSEEIFSFGLALAY